MDFLYSLSNVSEDAFNRVLNGYNQLQANASASNSTDQPPISAMEEISSGMTELSIVGSSVKMPTFPALEGQSLGQNRAVVAKVVERLLSDDEIILGTLLIAFAANNPIYPNIFAKARAAAQANNTLGTQINQYITAIPATNLTGAIYDRIFVRGESLEAMKKWRYILGLITRESTVVDYAAIPYTETSKADVQITLFVAIVDPLAAGYYLTTGAPIGTSTRLAVFPGMEVDYTVAQLAQGVWQGSGIGVAAFGYSDQTPSNTDGGVNQFHIQSDRPNKVVVKGTASNAAGRLAFTFAVDVYSINADGTPNVVIASYTGADNYTIDSPGTVYLRVRNTALPIVAGTDLCIVVTTLVDPTVDDYFARIQDVVSVRGNQQKQYASQTTLRIFFDDAQSGWIDGNGVASRAVFTQETFNIPDRGDTSLFFQTIQGMFGNQFASLLNRLVALGGFADQASLASFIVAPWLPFSLKMNLQWSKMLDVCRELYSLCDTVIYLLSTPADSNEAFFQYMLGDIGHA